MFATWDESSDSEASSESEDSETESGNEVKALMTLAKFTFSDNNSTSEENLNSECENEEDLQDAYNALYKESCKIAVKLKLQKEKFSKLKEGFESLILEKSHISD